MNIPVLTEGDEGEHEVAAGGKELRDNYSVAQYNTAQPCSTEQCITERGSIAKNNAAQNDTS